MPSNEREKLGQAFVEQATSARKDFDQFDAKVNESVSRILESYAKLAEQKPEELFGLRPSEKDKYFVERLLSSDVLDALVEARPEPIEPVEGAPGDITGSASALGKAIGLDALFDAISTIGSSEAGAKIVEELLSHIRAEKDFIKETGKEIIGWFGG